MQIPRYKFTIGDDNTYSMPLDFMHKRLFANELCDKNSHFSYIIVNDDEGVGKCILKISKELNSELIKKIYYCVGLCLDEVPSSIPIPIWSLNHIKTDLMEHQRRMLAKLVSKEQKFNPSQNSPFNHFNIDFPNPNVYEYGNVSVISSPINTGKKLVALSQCNSDKSKSANLQCNIIVANTENIPAWEDNIKQHYNLPYLVIRTIKQLRNIVSLSSGEYSLSSTRFCKLIYNYEKSGHKFGNVKNSHNLDHLNIKYCDANKYLSSQGHLLIDEINKYKLILISVEMYELLTCFLAIEKKRIHRVFFSSMEHLKINKFTPLVNSVMYYYITNNKNSVLIFDKFGYQNHSIKYNDQQGINMIDINLEVPYYIKAHKNFMTQTFCKLVQDIPYILSDTFDDNSPSLLHFKNIWENIFIFSNFDITNIRDKFIIRNQIISSKYSDYNLNDGISPEVVSLIHQNKIPEVIQKLKLVCFELDNIIKSNNNPLITELAEQKEELAEVVSREVDLAEEERAIAITDIEKKISVINDKLTNINDRIKNTEDCPICMCDITHPTVLKCCQNVLCFNCIIVSLLSNPSCPMCRGSIEIPDSLQLMKTDDMTEIIETIEHLCSDIRYIMEQSSDKSIDENFNRLIRHIKERNVEKGIPTRILICCPHYSFYFNKVSNILTAEKIRFKIYYHHYTLKADFDEFFKGDLLECMIFTNRFSSNTDYSLDNTTDVIIYNEGSPDNIIDYAINIASSINRKTPLNVWDLKQIDQIPFR